MSLLEEKTSPYGRCSAGIYMRPDRLNEGRTDCRESPAPGQPAKRMRAGVEVCGVTETLPRLETIVKEELEL
jgi:hypothetical protein